MPDPSTTELVERLKGLAKCSRETAADPLLLDGDVRRVYEAEADTLTLAATRLEEAEGLARALEIYADSKNWTEADDRACGCTFYTFQHPDADGKLDGGFLARAALTPDTPKGDQDGE